MSSNGHRRGSRFMGHLVVVAALVVSSIAGGALGFLAQGEPRPFVAVPPESAPAPLPETRDLTPDTLLAWTPGGLPTGLASRTAGLRGVENVVSVASGTAWLTGSVSAEGAVADHPPAGLAIPIEVAAADPSAYAPFLSPAERTVLPHLARGEAVLGASGAGLRGFGEGAILRFGRVELRVAEVLPDEAMGAHEMLVSRRTGERLGVTTDRYLLIDPTGPKVRDDLTRAIRRGLPPGTLLRVRGPGETPYFRQGDAVLPQVRLKEIFGEFAARPIAGGYLAVDPSWVSRSIVTAPVPVLGSVRCHRSLLPQLRGALGEIEARGLSGLIDPGDYAGCYSARFLNRNPRASISHHGWGVALDINVSANVFGRTPHQDPRLVSIFERWGFTWGGDWILPDGMHFEFVRFPSER